ncbi:MAG: SDR family oxidoreductase [Terriglobales bacterium]|jgi:NAD(P)-dependent dehydrogenase (short-subunit alcohol dehydrogenase family)
MNLELDGKRAFVTGSTAGIGYAIAEALAREGAEVVVNGRTEERVEKAISAILASHPRAKVKGLAADLGHADGISAAVQRLPEVDILINNLAIFDPKPFEQIPDEDWFRFFEVNVMSGVRLSRQYLPGMKTRNWGRIIFISSESAVQIPAEMIHYGMTKTAQIAISRGLAETTTGTGVTVNAVLPGPTASEGVTKFVDRMAAASKQTKSEFEADFFRSIRPSSLLQRFARPDEVAPLVVFLCSPLSTATNGAALRADGGVVRSIL